MYKLGALVTVCSIAWIWVVPAQCGTPRAQLDRIFERAGLRRVLLRIRGGGATTVRRRNDAAVIGAALTAVAARLTAGQSPADAWRATLQALPDHLTRAIEDLVVDTSSRPRVGDAPPRREVRDALRAARAATVLARELGTELAPILHACATGIEESARASAERGVAFAGPKATARLLLALPIAGVFLGSIMGADPLGLFTTTVWGAALGVAAGILVVFGHVWITRLLHRAERAGQDAA